MENDLDLLRKYSREGCEAAFAEVVRRHVDLVYSVAYRNVRSQQLAEEITQSTFLDLAKSIGRLRPGTVVSAWLHQVARRTAVDAVRREMRRGVRERMAVDISALESSDDASRPDWEQIEPILDDEMAELQEADRVAIALRFFEGKSLSEVGRAIGLSDDAAQKRVSRALERLRLGLQRRGVTVGAGALAALVSTRAVDAAPAGLASSVGASVASMPITAGALAAAARQSLTVAAVQKGAIAVALAGSIGVAAYQTKRCHRLERELAATRERAELKAGDASAGGAVMPAAGSPESGLDAMYAIWADLQAERDRLVAQRDAAERLARLYAEVATTPQTAGASDQFPTARHVTAAMGRLLRKSVLMQEALKDMKLEELSPEDQRAIKSNGVGMMGEVATLAEAELRFSGQAQESMDPVDDLTVFAYGALDLDEAQFQQVYSLLRELQTEADGLGRFGNEPSDEDRTSLEALKAEGRRRFKSLLTPDQQQLYRSLEPHLPLVRSRPVR